MTTSDDIFDRARGWLKGRPLITVGDCSEYFYEAKDWALKARQLNIRGSFGDPGEIVDVEIDTPLGSTRPVEQLFVGIDDFALVTGDWGDALTSDAVTNYVKKFDRKGKAVVLMNKHMLGFRVGNRMADVFTSARSRDAGRKTDARSIFGPAGVPLVPSQVVSASDAAQVMKVWRVMSNHGRLPTVWSGDINGYSTTGADTYLITSELDAIESLSEFHERYEDDCRIAAFRDGLPFSVTFYVAEDGEVFVLPPMEQIVYGVDGSFLAIGHSSFLQIDKLRMDAIINYAYQMGTHLRDTVGFKSFGTLDGYIGMRTDFSDLNPWPTDSVDVHARVSEQPLQLLHMLTMSGQSRGLDLRAVFGEVWRAHARAPIAIANLANSKEEDGEDFLLPDGFESTVEIGNRENESVLISRQRPRTSGSVATGALLPGIHSYLAVNHEATDYELLPSAERAATHPMPGLVNRLPELEL